MIEARWVVPVEPARSVLPDHAVVVTAGRIVALLPSPDARARYRPRRHVALDQHALIPGLINLHTHAAMTLMRGLADDLALMDWLKNHVWPAEMRHVSDAFVYDGTRLACAEMLRGGVTCFNDMYFFPRASARAALRSRHARRAGPDRARISDRRTPPMPGLSEQGPGGARRNARRTAAVSSASHRTRPTRSATRVCARSQLMPASSICRCTCTCTRRATKSSKALNPTACARCTA